MSFLFAFCLFVSPDSLQNDSETHSVIWISMQKTDLEICQNFHKDFDQTHHVSNLVEVSGTSVFSIPASMLNQLAGAISSKLQRHGGFATHPTRQQALDTLARLEYKVLPDQSYTIDRSGVVQSFLNELSESVIRETIISLSSFTNRYFQTQSGAQAADWIYQTWSQYADGSNRASVSYFEHPGFLQPSVIFTLQGRVDSNDSIVLGAHMDTKVPGQILETTRSPGADDNASGIACLTELIRACVELNYHPDYTVHFMAFAAEEVGLFGSGSIARDFFKRSENVLGMLQLDMTNYYGSEEDINFISDYTDANQNAFLMTLVDTYLGLTYTSEPCGYGCSDHFSWTAQGYPASFPFEARFTEYNPFIHSDQDTLENCGDQTSKALDFTHLASVFMVEVAKGDMDAPSPPGNETRWIPHVTRQDGGFLTRFIINNTGAESAMEFFAYDSSGKLLEKSTQTVPSDSFLVLTEPNLFTHSEVSHFSVFGPESVQVVAAISAGHGQGSSAHIPESGVYSTEISFFTGEWESIFDGLALVNAGDSSIQVQILLQPSIGDPIHVILAEDLAPKAKLLTVLDQVFDSVPADSRITIECSGPFAATILRGTTPSAIPSFLFQTVPLTAQGAN